MARHQKGGSKLKNIGFLFIRKGEIKEMARHQRGSILILSLLIIFVGAIIMAALMANLTTAMSATSASDERSLTYYAADSGVEDAVFWLNQGQELAGWTETEEEQWEREPYEINGRTVVVSVEHTGNHIYKITSRAITDSGANNRVESYISAPIGLDLTPFADNVITGDSSVVVRGNKGDVRGNITYVDSIECPGDPNCEESINGTITQDPDGIDWWPETEQLIEYFSDEVDKTDPYPWDSIEVTVTPTIGPLYRDGDLIIRSSVEGEYLTLTGTIYVTGELSIGQHDKEFTLDLNGQNIFVENPFTEAETCGDSVLVVGGKCTIIGAGSIIGIGDVCLLPSVAHGDDSFMLIMSAEGDTKFQPIGDFYGCIAGRTLVDVSPNIYMTQSIVDFPLDFPGAVKTLEILTYSIIK